MTNPNVDRELRRIQAGVPEHLANKLMKEVRDDSQEELARAALASPDISAAKKEVIRKKLESGAFAGTVDHEVDEEVAAEIERYNEGAVKAAIARGDLPAPDTDPFVRKRAKAAQDARKGFELTKEAPMHAHGAYALLQPVPWPWQRKTAIYLGDIEQKKRDWGAAKVLSCGDRVFNPGQFIGRTVLYRKFDTHDCGTLLAIEAKDIQAIVVCES